MTSLFPDQHPDTQIFILSALGSLLLHGLIMVGLSYVPKSEIVKDKSTSVQVTLMAPPQDSHPSERLASPMQPRVAMPKALSLPPRLQRAKPTPPLQTSLTPSSQGKMSPLTPRTPTTPILQDMRASQAMKVREMMKMRVPAPTQQALPSLSNMKNHSTTAQRVMPPLPTARKERARTRALPAPPRLAAPQPLTAIRSTQTKSMMTRPSIISSSKPVYPRIARESGWEGTVVVRTLIDSSGIPSQVKLRKSCGYPTLDEAAQAAVKNWTFEPAKDGNIPIEKWVDVPIKFDLNS